MCKLNKIAITAITCLAALSCSKYGENFENKVFINADKYKNEVKVATDDGVKEMSKNMSVAIAKPVSNDIKVSFKKSPELLETYRQAYYDSKAELLPDANCDLSGIEALIRKGDVLSENVNIKFTGLDKLDYSKNYVLPVSIETGDAAVLNRSKTVYFVVKEASLVNYVADMKNNRAWPIWDNFDKVKDLETFTMECLVNCHAFNNKSKILTIMGVEDHFLIRIGDVTIPQNQIQIACAVKDIEGNSTYRADVTNPALQLRVDRWYHVAVTFNQGIIKVYLDGKLRAEGDVSEIAKRPNKDTGELESVYFKKVDFSAPHSDESDGKPRCFWVGYSYDKDRSLDGMIAEARVWNRVLDADEINKPNHFYKLYPADINESLIAYWKFDDGGGKIIRDHSLNGKNLTADHELVWYPVDLPVKK